MYDYIYEYANHWKQSLFFTFKGFLVGLGIGLTEFSNYFSNCMPLPLKKCNGNGEKNLENSNKNDYEHGKSSCKVLETTAEKLTRKEHGTYTESNKLNSY